MAGRIDDVLKAFVKIDEDLLGELEEALICADVGAPASALIIERLRAAIRDKRLTEPGDAKAELVRIVAEMMGASDEAASEDIFAAPGPETSDKWTPVVILVVGVNGAGKTTTVGKVASIFRDRGMKVVVAAADTFRAAAAEQLGIWAERSGADIVRGAEGSDPASVVYDAISSARGKKAGALLVDTAGRLHNKKNLMDELAKISRVITRELPGARRETLLVLDATTGQNALSQAKEFARIAEVTGVALTKLDGTAKGGFVVAVRHELGIPVKLVGVGEKLDDHQPFDAGEFARALFEE